MSSHTPNANAYVSTKTTNILPAMRTPRRDEIYPGDQYLSPPQLQQHPANRHNNLATDTLIANPTATAVSTDTSNTAICMAAMPIFPFVSFSLERCMQELRLDQVSGAPEDPTTPVLFPFDEAALGSTMADPLDDEEADLEVAGFTSNNEEYHRHGGFGRSSSITIRLPVRRDSGINDAYAFSTLPQIPDLLPRPTRRIRLSPRTTLYRYG